MLTFLASSGTSLDPISILNTFGWPTLVAIALGVGWLVPGYLYKQIRTERDQLRALIDDLVQPALREGVAALSQRKDRR